MLGVRARILLFASTATLGLAGVVGCGGAPVGAPVPRGALPPALGPPAAMPAGVRGAAYLTQVATQIQPNWAHFLEDCRIRLAADHPLNVMTLVAVAELAIDRTGKVAGIGIATSGSADFDLAVRDVLADASRVAPPPIELVSDDDRAHVRWTFARDLRQAGPATASVIDVQLPLLAVTDRLLGQGELARAARRVAAAPITDGDRLVAGERVMTHALREALGTGAGARKAAVEAIGRAKVRALAAPVRAMISPTIDTELRLAAIKAAAQLEDQAAADVIAGLLPGDLQNYPHLAQAEIAALVALGQRERAASMIRTALDSDAAVTALHAHALVPDPALAPRLATWFKRGDARTRAAVCVAVPAQWDPQPLVLRGLRDADATVRAACADTAGRQARAGKRIGGPALAALRELVHNRDRVVRARAVAALSFIEPRSVVRAAADPAPEVRAAAVAAATEAELRTLGEDPDPGVRAAALATIGDRAPELLARHASDVAPQVRLAVVSGLADDAILGTLGTDGDPEVATAAIVRLATRRGRAAVASALLAQLAGAPPGSAERVRIALGFLLAR